jgi:hypothetical protein
VPFLDSEVIRPIYDVHDGGPPAGYRCCLNGWSTTKVMRVRDLHKPCGRVTRTLAGMRTHQRIVHDFKAQGELDFGNLPVPSKVLARPKRHGSMQT